MGARRRRRRAPRRGDLLAGGVEVVGQLVGPFGERLGGAAGQRPRAVAADADRGDPVATRVGGTQHVRGTRAADVVLGGPTAEQDDEVDPSDRTAFRADGTVSRRAVPGNRGGIRHRRSPGRARRRARRCLVRLPFGAARPAVRPAVAERDGHEFIADALGRGAGAYLTSRPAGGGTAIEVDDTLRALMDLARVLRAKRFAGPVVGDHRQRRQDEHQGSRRRRGRRQPAGARQRAQLQQRPGSADDDPGHAGRRRRCWSSRWACAAPARSPGCARIAAPQIGVVTRVAEAHGELVGGIDGVARAKGELIEALPAERHGDPQRRRRAGGGDGIGAAPPPW